VIHYLSCFDAVYTASEIQKYLFNLKLRTCFADKHKKALLFYRETFNYSDFGGISSWNAAFRSNPKGFELLKTYLAMFLRTSSLKRLNSFGAAEKFDTPLHLTFIKDSAFVYGFDIAS